MSVVQISIDEPVTLIFLSREEQEMGSYRVQLSWAISAASLGWSEFSHRLCLFLSGDYKGRPAQMWVFTHADCGCSLSPPDLSSLLRQPAPFSFIPNFSLEIAAPKPAIPITRVVGGLDHPCRCMGCGSCCRVKGPGQSETLALPSMLDLALAQLPGLYLCLAASAIPRAPGEAGGTEHWKPSQTF